MKEKITWMVVYIIAVLIGVGLAIIVTKAIEQAKIEACFDYKDPEICEEVTR